MFKNLRILFSIIGSVLIAATIFVFVFFGMAYGFVCLGGAVLCWVLTVHFKNKQEESETPTAKHGDFITGKSDEND